MKESKAQDSRLVSDTIEKLRELVFSQPADSYLGSMNEVASHLGVGIVTIQQATRILEHEGLLTIKRGPGGGYYGTRPDDAALERSFATYMRAHDVDYRDAFEVIVSLDCDLAQAAADSGDDRLEDRIQVLIERLALCQSAEDCIQFEVDFRNTLFSIVNRPLLELLARVAMQQYKASERVAIFDRPVYLTDWRQGREKILRAILQRDGELADFEAHRFRRLTQKWMQG